ncbi:hypothetical protein GF342_00270 [Candidatus Woesearchaeota archaeon]|nr:hypothetical protein [Candidatus Woesearchaeota archaeon]
MNIGADTGYYKDYIAEPENVRKKLEKEAAERVLLFQIASEDGADMNRIDGGKIVRLYPEKPSQEQGFFSRVLHDANTLKPKALYNN